MNWYIVESGQATGPHDHAAIEHLIATGRLTGSTKVCVVGAKAWSAAVADPVIAGLLASAASPYTPPNMSAPALHPPLGDTPIPVVGIGPFSFGNASTLANKAFRARWFSLVIIGIVAIVLGAVQQGPGMIADEVRDRAVELGQPVPAGAMALRLLGWGLMIAVGWPLYAGVVLAGARAVRGAGAVSDLFVPFFRYGAVLLATLVSHAALGLLYIIAILPGLIVAVAIAGVRSSEGLSASWIDAPALALAFLLMAIGAIVVSILFTPRLVFMGVLAADPSRAAEPLEATLRFSWSATSGHAPAIFGLLFVYGLLYALSVLLLCVGLPLIGLPLLIVAVGAAYATLFNAGFPDHVPG